LNLSVSIPKQGDQNELTNGIMMLPSFANALNAGCASA
jgi:hypothetical protein